MSDEKRKILEMLAEGKISTDDAERLLSALGEQPPDESKGPKDAKRPKYLHVHVNGDCSAHGGGRENVNIKIPLGLLRAGMKLKSLIPEKARSKVNAHLSEHGVDFDFNDIDAEKLDVLLKALTETSIDIDSDKESVKIYCA
jgi:hypothetical protein